MKSNCLKKTLFIFLGIVVTIATLLTFLLFDAFYGGKNFRTMHDPISSSETVDLRGLRELKASGGNAPRMADLQRRLAHRDEKKLLVEVQSERFGYVDGIPVQFLGYGRPKPSIRHLLRRLVLTGTFKKNLEWVIPEDEEAKKYGFDYKKIVIGSKYVSKDPQVENFITFIDQTPIDTWLHFHCVHGHGRTSIALVMLDIMRNAPQVALKDILKRHTLLGSEDLTDTRVWDKGTYTFEQLQNRKEFISDFYDFICQRKSGGSQTWAEWKRLPQQNS